tara:strand:+ start:1155 stop:1907 length:753 start_codon:yes stop_codon:yes gene_type:complete
MARKTLLTESEIRQFMKLANLAPLGDAKIEEMYGASPGNRDKEEHKKEMNEDEELDENESLDEEDDIEEGRGGGGSKPPMDRDEDELDEMGQPGPVMDRDEDEMRGADDMGDAEMDMGAAEMDMDAAADDMDADMGGMDDAEREEVMADVVRAVAQALGIEDQVSVEAGEDDGMEGGELDAMPEPAPDDEPAMEMGDEDPMMEDEELYEADEDELVAEVARRVAERLQVQNRKEQIVDSLAERIMKRLTK